MSTNSSTFLWILTTSIVAAGMSACAYEPPSVNQGSGGSSSASSSTGAGGEAGTGSGGGTASSSSSSGGVGGGGGASSCASGEACVPAAPPGWTGPYRSRSGMFGQLLSNCPDGTKQIYRGSHTPAPPATCACDCNCEGMGCTAPQITCWGDPKCGLQMGSSITITPTSAQDCAPLPFFGGNIPAESCTVTKTSVVIPAKTCAPSNPLAPELPPFATEVQICPMQEAGNCDEGRCAPINEPDLANLACVVLAGTHACPSQFPNRREIYQNWIDDRSCGDCSANLNAVVCSPPEFKLAVPDCTLTEMPITQECTATNGFASFKYFPASAEMSPNACKAPYGGLVTGIDPLTICCMNL